MDYKKLEEAMNYENIDHFMQLKYSCSYILYTNIIITC